MNQYRVSDIMQHDTDVAIYVIENSATDLTKCFGLRTRWEACKVDIIIETANDMGIKFDDLILHPKQALNEQCCSLLNGCIIFLKNLKDGKEFTTTMTLRSVPRETK